MIFATKGKAKIPSSNLVIEGDKFIYNKKDSELIIIDNVKYFDSENNIYIKSEKIIYNENENSVFSFEFKRTEPMFLKISISLANQPKVSKLGAIG